MEAKAGEILTAKQLFNIMLVGSKNDAALALASVTMSGQYRFVQEMNEKAISLGMANTVFVDPTGLYAQNKSTAEDIARLLNASLQKSEIAAATSQRNYFYHTKG